MILEEGGGRELGRLDPVHGTEDVEYGPVVEVQRYVVEHDGDHDLVDVEASLQEARHRAPDGAGGHAAEQHERHVHDGRGLDGQGHGGGGQGPYHDLPLGADIEEPRPEGEADAEARQDDGHGLDDELAYVPGIEAARREVDASQSLEDGVEHHEGVLARYEHDYRSEEEPEGYGEEGHEDLMPLIAR